MTARIAVVHEPRESAVERSPSVAGADLLLNWYGERANVLADTSYVHAAGPVPPLAQDLLDIAVAVYIADIAVLRGEREAWPRDLSLALPVRERDFWREHLPGLRRLLYLLTRDNVRIELYDAPALPPPEAAAAIIPRELTPDCVAMLSGGLDSLAGAVMLQVGGRRPIYSLHRSGNPAVRSAQEAALQAIEDYWPGRSASCPYAVAPNPRGANALSFPPAEDREPSRRARSLLFMTLAALTADAAGLSEVFMCENGVLTAGLPISASRAGSLSTHSTHPAALNQFNQIVAAAGMDVSVTNPFVYQTKADLIRDVLKPHLTPQQIQSTVSCWAAGRAQRQCGGCIPCLLRRIGMRYAGLPEEAYMIDVLGRPGDYVGTDAYGNLVDLLRRARQICEQDDQELINHQPALLTLGAAGVDISQVIGMLRRHADQTLTVVREHYPRAARLIR